MFELGKGVFNLAAAVSGGSAEGSGVVATPGCFTLAKVRFGVTNTPGCLSVHMVVSSVGPGIIGVSTPGGFGVVASSRKLNVVGSLLDSGGVVTPGYNSGHFRSPEGSEIVDRPEKVGVVVDADILFSSGGFANVEDMLGVAATFVAFDSVSFPEICGAEAPEST